jgi:hypothetical protein
MGFSVGYNWNAEGFLFELNGKEMVVQRRKHTRYSKVLQVYKFSNESSSVSGGCTFRYLV